MTRSAIRQGLVAGAAGAVVMTLGEKVEQRFTHRPDSLVPARDPVSGMRRRTPDGSPTPVRSPATRGCSPETLGSSV